MILILTARATGLAPLDENFGCKVTGFNRHIYCFIGIAQYACFCCINCFVISRACGIDWKGRRLSKIIRKFKPPREWLGYSCDEGRGKLRKALGSRKSGFEPRITELCAFGTGILGELKYLSTRRKRHAVSNVNESCKGQTESLFAKTSRCGQLFIQNTS